MTIMIWLSYGLCWILYIFRLVAEASVDDAAVAPVQYEAQNLEVPVVIVTSEAADLTIWDQKQGFIKICDIWDKPMIYDVIYDICHLSI